MVSDPTTPRSLGDKDAAHLSPVTPAEDVRTVLINNLSWGAVLAGVVIALVTQVLLNILGLAVGSATIDPMTGDNPSAKLLTFTAAIWWAFSGIIASFVGGLAAGRLSGRPKETTTAWHGLIAWGLTTLIVVFLVSSTVGSVIGGAFNAVGGALGGIGRTAIESAAPALAGADNPMNGPMSGIERRIRTATGSDPQELQDAAVASMQALLTGDASQQAEAREQAAQVLAKAQNIGIEEARQQVAQYEARYKEAAAQAEQKAKEAAEVAAKAAARGAAVIFFALLFGALAAWIGGRAGAVEPTVTPGRPGMRVA